MNRLWIILLLLSIAFFLFSFTEINKERSSILQQNQINENNKSSTIDANSLYSCNVSSVFNSMFQNDASLQLGKIGF